MPLMPLENSSTRFGWPRGLARTPSDEPSLVNPILRPAIAADRSVRTMNRNSRTARRLSACLAPVNRLSQQRLLRWLLPAFFLLLPFATLAVAQSFAPPADKNAAVIRGSVT